MNENSQEKESQLNETTVLVIFVVNIKYSTDKVTFGNGRIVNFISSDCELK